MLDGVPIMNKQFCVDITTTHKEIGKIQRYHIKILKIASGPITPHTKNFRLNVMGVAKCLKKVN